MFSISRLMNGSTIEDKSASWQQAVGVDMNSILFMHCHQVKKEKAELLLNELMSKPFSNLNFPIRHFKR